MLVLPHLAMPLLLNVGFYGRRVPQILCTEPAEERELATQYTSTDLGISYIDTLIGDGEEVFQDDLVSMHYTGSLLSDSSKVLTSTRGGEPLVFKLGEGKAPLFEDACTGMRVGGKRRVLVPPKNNVPNWESIGSETGRFDIEVVGKNLPGAGEQGINRRQVINVLLALSFIPYFLPDDKKPFLWREDSVPTMLGIETEADELTDEGIDRPLTVRQKQEVLREERALVSDEVERELYGR
jgi:hypothetical protein